METKTEIKSLKAQSHGLDAVVRIGKQGLTETTLDEIKRQLKKKKLIKVKFLRASLQGKNKKELAKDIAEKTGALLVHTVGLTGTYYKK